MNNNLKLTKGQIANIITDATQAVLDALQASKADLSAVVLKNGNTDGGVLNIGTNDAFNVRFEYNNTRKVQITSATLGIVEGVAIANDASGNKFQLSVGSDTASPTLSRNTADGISTLVLWNIHNSNTGYIIEGKSGSAGGGTLVFYVDKSGKVKVTSATLDEHAVNLGQVNTLLAAKQAALVSGTNIKTVNGNSLLGSGNVALGDVNQGGNTYGSPMVTGNKEDQTVTSIQNSTPYQVTNNTSTTHSRPDNNFAGNVKITGAGDFENTNSSRGIILKSPNGTRYRVTVSDTGVLTTTAI